MTDEELKKFIEDTNTIINMLLRFQQHANETFELHTQAIKKLTEIVRLISR